MRLLIECDYLYYILNPRASKNKKLNTFLKQKGTTKTIDFARLLSKVINTALS